ncbi:MAG: ATP-binding cassette domain-containing protein [Candidatus Thiodiazotropha endolucinida]
MSIEHKIERGCSLLSVTGLTKSYDQVAVVKDVKFAVNSGDVIGIIGSNGSGKSTLLHMLCGFVRPDLGQIFIEDKPVSLNHPKDGLNEGIAMLSQFPDLCPDLSVAENIFLGQEPRKHGLLTWFIDWISMHDMAVDLLREAGNSNIPPAQPAATLSGGQKKVVTLARLIARNAKIVLLDEPTASLALKQKQVTMQFIKECRKRGVAVLLITHDPEEVLEVCDRVIAIQLGKIADEFTVSPDCEEKLTKLLAFS